MGATSTARVHRFRERQRTDQVCLLITVSREPLAQALISAKVFDPLADDSPENLARSVERLLELLSMEKTE
jgi:hypothetical protein